MITIYTDGSCINNPGIGGWAAIIINKEKKKIIKGTVKNTTNNQMELTAPIEALKTISKIEEIEIITDSKYVKMGITEWIQTWKKNGWKAADKKKVKNIELWIELEKLTKNFKIKWSWVKGHSNNYFNNEVDKLAREAASLDLT